MTFAIAHEYASLASPQVPTALNNHPLILPVGAIEQHGPHLPLSVDIDIAEAIAGALAARLGGYATRGIAYAARSLPHSGGGYPFPGTISVRGSCLTQYLVSILTAFAQHGARQLLVINGHYENESFLFEAIEICREQGTFNEVEVIALSWWSVVTDEFISETFGRQFPGWHAEHAGLCETSLMLHLRPELVGELRPNHPHPPIDGVYVHPIDAQALSDRGVLARTAGASARIGSALFEHVCNELEQLVAHPHGLNRRQLTEPIAGKTEAVLQR